MKIAPSILSADFANLKDDVSVVEKAGAEYLHIDIMDGHFVDNLTFGANVVKALRKHSELVFDCHMMVDEPEKYITDLKNAGADIVGVHLEATPHIHRVLSQIKASSLKAEVVLNPGTPVMAAAEILPLVDQVLIMTVDPGFGGQAFIPETVAKVAELAAYKKEHGLDFEIEVDGGINAETIKEVAQAGATVAVAGSYVFNAKDPAMQIATLKEAAR
ncbi:MULTISPECIES: ribulose-phosphate 3-epimerase [Ligilactobacillus]|uniref:Ribulose-phosphate 3-epimerase n=1 Tax=Ligilactobacillus animalis TaxID=1605 RepID=A0ABR4RPT7_9LACO|nr:ribulose-phosphate 3-epimerase [Ligilactobacillus animalis]KDA46072.1 ribulose-phosphate 3-epimerase, rpe [Ligilactobacillus animalis]MDQ2233811.1 ribulose-phosphate 3-epimerase [Ligilactobacillus animalis]MDU1488020.1 ribulose-phosphate 3-epimerase [Ligilactobacillus animalis]MEE0261138.1 ribulose-phosphate 3-epimerase [Ligilactobacillus animalis]OCX48675.1 ribulose-phosphate 3-epimerase [Ligilactobacillus animalis]